MAEEISNFVSKLRIDDEEDKVLDLVSINPNPENKISLLLLGRLLTERSFNVEAFKKTITGVWAPSHGLVIRVLRPNLFAFQFFHWRDMLRVLEGRPWCFDNMLVLLKEADGDEPPDQVILNQSPFWIRLKNLPFNMRSDDVVKALIGNMGPIIEIEEDVLGFGRYRRVKVLLDITKPLRRYRKLRDKKGHEIQVDFAYERLPFFCLACGVMGHSEKDCQIVLEEDKCESLGWHLGLKATPRKGRTKELEEEKQFRHCKKVLFDDSKPVRGDKLFGTINNSSLLPCTDGKSNSLPSHAISRVLSEPVLSPSPNDLAIINCPQVPQILESGKSTQKVHGTVHEAFNEVSPCVNPNFSPKEAAGGYHSLSSVVVPTAGDMCLIKQGASTNPSMQQMDSTDPPNVNFVFSSNKEPKLHKTHSWKRLARSKMDEKGTAQNMETDTIIQVGKRPLEYDAMVCDDSEGVGKRMKQNTSADSSTFFSAEVGLDQLRPSL